MKIGDAFADCHPLVNFIFYLAALVFAMIQNHPFYIMASVCASLFYWIILKKGKTIKILLSLVPFVFGITLLNPLFNTNGETILFTVFQRPYTLEALLLGLVTSGVFVSVLLWFMSYNIVMTGDKFTSLFGNLIPSLSLILVMIFRLVRDYLRKIRQITGARKCIGYGGENCDKWTDKLKNGLTVFSALTSWALENSVVMADSMRSRGYGTGKRNHFRILRFTARDKVIWPVCGLSALTALAMIQGSAGTEYLPRFSFTPLRGTMDILGFSSYCVLLLIPDIMSAWDFLQWKQRLKNMDNKKKGR